MTLSIAARASQNGLSLTILAGRARAQAGHALGDFCATAGRPADVHDDKNRRRHPWHNYVDLDPYQTVKITSSRVVAIGWLDAVHPFSKGAVDPEAQRGFSRMSDDVLYELDGPMISCFTLPMIGVGTSSVTEGAPGYRDSLCARIGTPVGDAYVDPGVELRIALTDGCLIAASLKPEDRQVEEAAELRDPLTNGWASW